MGRPKEELRKIHRKKVKKAKERIKAYLKGEIPFSQLNQLAKKLLEKRKRAEKYLSQAQSS